VSVSISQLPGLLQGLRACLEAELIRRAADGGAPVPGKIEVRPGAAFAPYFSTTEDECKCGVAWVRLVGVAIGGGDDGPPRNAAGRICGAITWEATVELGVQRCPAFGTAHVNPTGAESLGDVLTQLSDERAMRAAMLCCFPNSPDPQAPGQDVTPVEYTPIGPEGMCFGGTWTATLTLDDCDDCEE
jgi:hypothetical protein